MICGPPERTLRTTSVDHGPLLEKLCSTVSHIFELQISGNVENGECRWSESNCVVCVIDAQQKKILLIVQCGKWHDWGFQSQIL